MRITIAIQSKRLISNFETSYNFLKAQEARHKVQGRLKVQEPPAKQNQNRKALLILRRFLITDCEKRRNDISLKPCPLEPFFAFSSLDLGPFLCLVP